jgi:GT2 family glycosyltransferase
MAATPHLVPSPAERPLVSVVVAAYNDETHIAGLLDALARQVYPRERIEIVIVDDGSTDRTAEIVAGRPGVALVRQPNAGPSTARNAGLSLSTGSIVAFTDSDCEPAPDWVGAIAAAFAALPPSVAGIGGVQQGHPDDPAFAKAVDRFLWTVGLVGDYVKPFASARRVSHNASCNSAYRREALVSVGGFRRGLFPGEDVDLDRRLRERGHEIYFTPTVRVSHHRADSPARWRRLLTDYGASSAHNVLIHGIFRLVQAVPPLCVLAVAAAAALVALGNWPWAAIATVGGGTAVVAAVKGRSRLPWRSALLFTLQTLWFFNVGYWRVMVDRLRGRVAGRKRQLVVA